MTEVQTTPAVTPFDPLAPTFHADPYPVYRQYRELDPVNWGEPLYPETEAGCWYLFRYADVVDALRDVRFGREGHRLLPPDAPPPPPPGAFRQLAGGFMLFRDPPVHTRLRGLVNKAFTPRAVAVLRPQVRAIADALLDQAVAKGGAFDLIADYAFPLPVTVIAHILGVPPEDHRHFRGWSSDLAAAIDVRAGRDAEIRDRADRTTEELTAYLRQIVAARRRTPRDDIISALLVAEDGGERLSEQELLATCVLLLLAGHETTVNLIGNGTLALLTHLDQWDRLRQEPSFIPGAIEELLRYESPVQMTFRNAFADVELGGKTIRRGDLVGLVLGAANRDPAHYPNPDRLDVARTVGRAATFGMGIHFCLGAGLARLEGEVAFEALLLRMPELRLAMDAPEWRPDVALRGLKALPVSFA